MPFNAAGTYTPVTGAVTAAAGDVIRSATWNAIFTDMNTALTTVGQRAAIAPLLFYGFSQTAINFNSANTDTTFSIVLPTGYTRFRVERVVLHGASQTLTTATCGVFTAAAAGGTAIVTSGTAITVSTASEGTNNNTQSFTVNNSNTQSYLLSSVPSLFFRVQTAQGVAATGKVIIGIQPLL